MGGGGEEGQAPARSSRPPSCHARSVEFPLAALPTGLLSLFPRWVHATITRPVTGFRAVPLAGLAWLNTVMADFLEDVYCSGGTVAAAYYSNYT